MDLYAKAGYHSLGLWPRIIVCFFAAKIVLCAIMIVIKKMYTKHAKHIKITSTRLLTLFKGSKIILVAVETLITERDAGLLSSAVVESPPPVTAKTRFHWQVTDVFNN